MKQNIMNIFRYTIALAALLIMGTASAWAEDNYTITKANTENGSFSVTVGGEAASQAAAGATVTITTTPDNGYEVDGTPIVNVTTNWEKANTRAEIPAEQTISVTAGTANTWTFTMPNDNVTVKVVFKKIDYAITLPTVDGGTISVMKGTQPVTTANMGDEITLGNTPNEGWQFVSYSVKDAAGNDIDVTNGTFIMPIGAVTISATFEKIDYALTIPEGIEHGTVAIAGNNTTAQIGDEVTLITTPDAGYELESLTVTDANGNPITVTNGKFTMPAGAVTISATFKKIVYTINIDSNITGGTVAASPATATMGEEITLSNTPNEGWQFVSYSVKDANGNDVPVTNGKFTMPIGAVTISATFKKIDYALTIPEGIEHGTVAIAGEKNTAQIGDEVTLITTPDAGYELDAITVTDANGNPITVTNGKFIMPAGAVTISVTFKKIVYTINIDSNITGGTVAASPATATMGEEITLSNTPNEGWQFVSYSVKDANGNDVPVTNGKFTMPIGAVTISATFEKIDYALTIPEGIEHGTVAIAGNNTTAQIGDEVTLITTPDAGYELATLTVTDANGNPITVTNGKFIMPAGAVTISVTFKKIVYTITVDSDITGGMVTASATTATIGDEITLTISPSENYVILDVIVKDAAGNSIGMNTVGYPIRTFTMPASNVTVSVTFTYVEPTPEPEPTPTPTPTPTPEPEPEPTPGPEPGPTGVLVDVEATDAENTNEEVSNVKMQMAVAGETGKEEVTYTDENGNEQTKEMNVVPVMLDKISIPEQQETTQGEEKKELVVSIPAEILSNDGETIFRVTEIGENAMRSVEETAIVVGVIFPDTPDPIKVAEGALRVDNLPADDPNHRIASVETPLALLDNYALMSSLKENYEGAMVKAVAEPPHRFWTFSSGVDVQLPDGVGVYGCRVKSADEIEIMEIEGNDLLLSDGTRGIKANNAVFVACTNGSDGNAFDMVANPSGKQSGAIPSTENAKSYKDNELLPVIEDMHFAPGEVAILSDNRFHPIAAGDESKVPACKGVMPMTKLASTRSITIVGAEGTTAIKAAFAESLYAGDSKAEWYDLRGNRISRPSKKGIYVLNGKKVMIK